MTVLMTKYLPLVAGAPDGIKKVRSLILELAVRGLLLHTVRQPGSDIPVGWIQTKLGSILSFEYGDNLPAAKRSNTGEYPVYGSNGVVGTHNVSFVQQPCIVIGRKGSAGALNLCTSRGCCVTDVAYYCIPPETLSLEYAFKLLHTLGLDNLGKGIKPGLNRNEAYALDVLIPTLEEQHRIVAKVDELMALCDRLEADQADAEAAHAQLVQALLDSLTQATDADDFRASWQRLSEHFHTLFTTEASIDALKQTVLQLAIKGVLTRRLKTDVPASKLLEDLAADAATYCTQYKAPQPIVLPVSVDEEPFAIPNNWRWARLQSLFRIITDGDHQAPPRAASGVAFLTIGNVSGGRLEFDGCREVDESYFEDLSAYRKPAKGDLLYTVVGATYGRPVLVETDRAFCVQRHIAILKRSDLLAAKFALYLLASPFVYSQATLCITGTAQPTVPLKPLRNIVVPLPPLAEQHRIVAKVDELMALCDQLKAQLVEAREHHAQLATALVEQAVS